MAAVTMTMRAVKLAAIGSAAVPLIGFSGRLSAASNDEDGPKKNFLRACDLPLYNNKPVVTEVAGEPRPERNAVQIQITKFRIWAQNVATEIKDSYESVRSTAATGVENSKASLDYVQNNPGEFPRVVFISVATMGGIIMGYKRGAIRKLLFATIAGVSSAALCYPTFTVDLTSALKEDVIRSWKELIGGPSQESRKQKANPKRLLSNTPEDEKLIKEHREPLVSKMRAPKMTSGLEEVLLLPEIASESSTASQKPAETNSGDPGQSVEEDDDLYSTRT